MTALAKYVENVREIRISDAGMILKELRDKKLVRVSKGKEQEILEIIGRKLDEVRASGVKSGVTGVFAGAEFVLRKLFTSG